MIPHFFCSVNQLIFEVNLAPFTLEDDIVSLIPLFFIPHDETDILIFSLFLNAIDCLIFASYYIEFWFRSSASEKSTVRSFLLTVWTSSLTVPTSDLTTPTSAHKYFWSCQLLTISTLSLSITTSALILRTHDDKLFWSYKLLTI